MTATDRTTPANGGQTASGTASPITVTGLTNGDSYTFTVTATNGVGTGPASAASNAGRAGHACPGPRPSATATAGQRPGAVTSPPGVQRRLADHQLHGDRHRLDHTRQRRPDPGGDGAARSPSPG